MRDILRKAKPQRLDDLIALNALYRPGRLRSGMVDDWIARKQGKTEVKYDLPQLEPILRETYGVIAYQEQVMGIARVLGGFTLGEADILRRAMGKKKADVMQAQRATFVSGAKNNGVNEKKAGQIFGLTAIKNVGEGAIVSLLAVRAKQGRIRTLSALCEELDLRLVNKRVFESLIRAGAFDSLAPDATMSSRDLRPRLMAAVDAACEHGARMQDDRARGQAQLFGDFGHEDGTTHVGDGLSAVPPHGTLPNATPWTETEQLAFEKETLGLDWSGHPGERYAGARREFGAETVVDLADAQPAPEAENSGGPGRR